MNYTSSQSKASSLRCRLHWWVRRAMEQFATRTPGLNF